MVLSIENLSNQIINTVQNSAGISIPTSECVFDELAGKRFSSFTCTGSVNLTIVNSYVACILSVINGKFNVTNLNPLCSGVDFNDVGILLANCEWRTTAGNFQVGGKFITICHPISLPPQPESCLGLKYLLYTNLNKDIPQKIASNLSNIRASNFNFTENTTFLIGGWRGGSFQSSIQMIIPAILSCTNENVFVFDWGKGSDTFYSQAIANARLAASLLIKFIKTLNDKYNYHPSKIHLVGHSIGAHLAGSVGAATTPSIGRITGLDPAGNYFECDPELDPTDAVFVDIIHTNSGIVGTKKNLGDVDFWPNGGSSQPACSVINQVETLPLSNPQYLISCDHSISITYYANSMRFCDPTLNCTFNAFMCSNYTDFQAGACKSCGADGSKCAQMGYLAQKYQWANHPLPAPNPFYLKTGSKAPYYCLN